MRLDYSIDRWLRISGILVICGLLVEAICLMWVRPIAFVVLVVFGGTLISAGILFFLYSLVSGASRVSETTSKTHEQNQAQLGVR